MTHDVYISYAPRDKTVANAVRAVLESRGLSCWIASRDLAAGADAVQASTTAIEAAKVFVLIFSANSNVVENQIMHEAGLANERAMPLIGFRTANVAPGDTLKHFLKTHWIDAFVPPMDAHMRELADLILGLVGRRGGFVPTLQSIVPAGAPALQGAAQLAKNLSANLPVKINLPAKIDLKNLPTLPEMPALNAGAIIEQMKVRMRLIGAALALCVVAAGVWYFVVPHASPEDKSAWQIASRIDSVHAYQDYLKQFPGGYYADDATPRLAALQKEVEDAFAKAKASDTSIAYRAFLDGYRRHGIHVAAAQEGMAAAELKEKAEQAAFTAATKTKTRAGYEAFLAQYGNGANSGAARQRIAMCRTETRTVTANEDRTLQQTATGSGAAATQACGAARITATNSATALCSKDKGTMGGVRIVSEDPDNDASSGGRRVMGSLLGSVFNQGRAINLGSTCKVEVAAICRKVVTSTRPVDVCP